MKFYPARMTFKSHEIDFLRHADLGRLATIQRDGTPQNSPVGFTYNECPIVHEVCWGCGYIGFGPAPWAS